MKSKDNEMDSELKVAGKILQMINPFFTENRLRWANKLTRKAKSKIKDKTIHISQEWLPRKDGTKLRVCVYSPNKPIENVCAVLWLHGGGYAIGSPEMESSMIEKIMQSSNCVVVAPDYRLSFEAPYPAALEDAYQTLLWVKDNATALNINPNQLMVGGVSAGGGLSVALCLYARDKKEVAIAYQMPLYPMLDDRMISESATNNNAPLWNSQSNEVAWKLYLGELYQTSHVPAYAAPSRAIDYTNLPPAVTFVGELEPFKDEIIDYVANLKKAGVPVEFEIFKGCYHGFDVVNPKAKVSKKATAFFLNHFKHACKHYYAQPID